LKRARSGSRPRNGKARSRTGGLEGGVLSVLDLIGPDYVENGARTIGDRQVASVVRQAAAIRKRLRSGFALPRVRVRVELMLSLVEDFKAGRYRRVPYRSIALITFALSYLVAPVDVIPDTLPVIGEIDDAIVVALCARMVHVDLEAYGLWKLMHPKRRPARRPRNA
jgi:uncharacterized membrane protein YkvA (DUF1232 family)